MVVLLCAISPDEFVLRDVAAQYPDAVVEFERVIPTNHDPLPYLWVGGRTPPEFADVLAADSSVAAADKVAAFDEGALYRVDWRVPDGDLFEHLATSSDRITLLSASLAGDEWLLKIRFPSRSAFAEFRAFYQERGVDVRVVRLYDLENPKLDKYDLSPKQREGIVRALEMGYFEIPREATLEEVADSLEITSKSLSERLRRGQKNLFSSSLTMGDPDGVGIDDR